MIEAAQFIALSVVEFPVSGAATPVVLTRRGDGVMCVRFWGEITRGVRPAARQRMLTRAFPPKARSHHPITTPSVMDPGAMNMGHGLRVVVRKSGHFSRAVAKWGSDPNSGQGMRACQNSITELGSDPDFAVCTNDLNSRLSAAFTAIRIHGAHDD